MSPGDTELQPLVDILPFVIYGESTGEEEEEEGCCWTLRVAAEFDYGDRNSVI